MLASDLRIALFSGNYNYVRDGANQALNRLMGSALAAGAAVRVYSPTIATPAFPPTGDLVSVPSWSMPGGRGEYRLARGLPDAVRADLEAYRPNIVHVSAPDILGHRAVSWAHAQGIATIASLHTRFETYPRYYHLGFTEPLLVWAQKRFYNRVDQVMVPSQSMVTLLREWGVSSPIGVWSRGINHARFNPGRRDEAWRRALGIAEHEVAVGFLGRLVLEKGLGVFADVVAALKARGVPHKVLVIGDGPAREWFARRVPEAAFTGFQAGDDLGRAVAGMDIFFMPSVTETFGNVTTEAMAAGVPVVAARATGSVDLVVDGVTGFLVPPQDVSAYADAIQRLIEDPALRRAAGLASHERVRGYEWEEVNADMLKAYEALAHKA
ncbi:glycosyltransferase family 4 protein [Sphingobium lignivorans]|uniref:Glycosyltransferase involved in cell wall biosynthesis n=1 Tax=Sphingobium lignivorans TaxID=2735886 RepID=A0ABR6NFR0_9SPHN|nr:glycosyltransferase family 1 protein [Sphingobium lignivorans]MBB5986117.1 glycosyltransferase involved in cell wall biosynthesis [Sphingobium lignivorans]